MTRKRQNLFVSMNGVTLGALTRESSGELVFCYAKDWLNHKNVRPISLSLPLSERPYKGYLVECYFNNLLPDRELIRERIQARFQIPSNRCFDLLSQIGRDCIGALQITPQANDDYSKAITGHVIDDLTIAQLLKQYQTAPLGMSRDSDFRISIAGAQEKTALLWYQEKWHLPASTTPTSHIFKLPIGHIKHSGIDLSNSVENEWLCLQILSAFGLRVNHAQILYFTDVKTLVVERFDRRWSADKQWLMRLPQEDLCQALGESPGLKCESDGGPGIQAIMTILLGSKQASHDRYHFMKTVFLFWVMGAIDGHAKNFSISLEGLGRYQLTPLYDVMSAYPLATKRQLEWQNLKMAMSLKSKSRHYSWHTIQLRHWLAMANYCQFSEKLMQQIIDEVFDSMEKVIEQVTTLLPASFPKEMSDAIFSGMRVIKNRC